MFSCTWPRSPAFPAGLFLSSGLNYQICTYQEFVELGGQWDLGEPELGVGLHCHEKFLQLLELGKTAGEPAQSVALDVQIHQVGQLLPEVLGELLKLCPADIQESQVVESQDALRELAKWVAPEFEPFKLGQLAKAFWQPNQALTSQIQHSLLLEALPTLHLCCFH